ncbi:MAG: TRAP transporter substrate-binding protein DctP [Deltaproteobacteria bacterium]|nr:TRAP transporter substrate-binding protein DctP [Deltaproteobacteria bacterium]
MRKKMILFLVLSVGMMGLLSGPNKASAQKKVYNLKLQSYYSPAMISGDKKFAETIEKMSNGRIKVTVFSGGELVASDQILHAVKAGTVDIGHGYGAYYPDVAIGIIESGLPMAWNSAVEAELLYEQYGLLPLVSESYKKAGVHYLGPTWAAPYAILTKKPIANLDDLRKLKIRTTAGAAKMFNKVGVSTVYLPPEEVYLALSTGQIDGVLYGCAEEYKINKFYEVAPYYCTSFILNPIVDCMVINEKVWSQLPDDLKSILTTATYRARWHYYMSVFAKEYSVREEIFKGKLTSLPPEDIEKLTNAAFSVWEEEAKKSPSNARAVNLLKDLNKKLGRLK